jgi:1-acyl-sn-glycerol-3-phosphate acyltransferase
VARASLYRAPPSFGAVTKPMTDQYDSTFSQATSRWIEKRVEELTARPRSGEMTRDEQMVERSESVQTQRRFWFVKLARKYVRARLCKEFDGVFVRGLAELKTLCETRPVIIAANHTCWWDAFLMVLLDEALDTESYCLMDRENLDRLGFFAWIGAVPLDRDDPKQCVRDLEESVRLLDRPKRVLWIFPQGEQRPFHLRPLNLQSGVAYAAQKSGATVVPLSISYMYAESPRPRIIACFASPMPLEPMRLWRGFLRRLEAQLLAGLQMNDRFLLAENSEYRKLLASKRDSSNTPKGARLLSRLVGRPKAMKNQKRNASTEVVS